METFGREAMQVSPGRDAWDSPFAGAQPHEQMNKIKTLNEFLAWRGFAEDARKWSRCFYKYTDCGPWVVFLMKDHEAFDTEHPPQVACFRKSLNSAILENVADLADDFIRFLGYDKEGLSRKERTWETYNGLVDKFCADEDKQHRTGRELEIVERTATTLVVKLPAWVEHTGATHREIYYEDIGPKYSWQFEACPCEGVSEEPCERCDGEGSLRVWRPTGEVVEVVPELCVGIKFGSIVEGSEFCSGPFEYLFPFDGDEFDRDLEHMEAETSFYWDRDNSQWYTLRTPKNEYYLKNTWGDITWEEKPNKVLREKVESYINADGLDIPMIPGYYAKSNPDWEPAKIPGTRSTIHEFCNDSDY